MTQPYSSDLRERVVRAHLAGEPIRRVAARFGVSVSSVPKWVARCRATGSVAPCKIGGHRLWFLPPYSPDLNPIERAFAKIEHWMRNAQRRNVEDTWRHLGHLIATIEPSECQNYIRSVGYGSV
jgi:transposase